MIGLGDGLNSRTGCHRVRMRLLVKANGYLYLNIICMTVVIN